MTKGDFGQLTRIFLINTNQHIIIYVIGVRQIRIKVVIFYNKQIIATILNLICLSYVLLIKHV